jgi:hypothetical protein
MAEKEIKQEDNEEDENSKSAKIKKTLGTYTNWFALDHWPSIFAVVKKHGDLINVLHYLKPSIKNQERLMVHMKN